MSPDAWDPLGDDMRATDTPVYVIGGGKTGMDTAHALITGYPGRKVGLVAGSGTMFASRDKTFPTGLRRAWGGTSPTNAFLDVARRFDGTNERAVHAYFRSRYGTSLTEQCDNFMFGLLSERERDVVAGGLGELMMEHLEDVVDRNGEPVMVFRSGRSRPIEPDSWVVNCSGYLFQEDQPYEPYVSDSGAVLSIQSRSAVHAFPTLGAYFLTHLLYLDKLAEVPLYALDGEVLRKRHKAVLPYAVLAMTMHNVSTFLHGNH